MTTDVLPDLLNGVSPEDAAAVLALGSRMRLAPGAVLFPLGSPADSLYLITHGRVSLTLPMQVGGSDEDILVEERGPGETIGWSAMVPPYRFTLEARAPLDTEVLAFSRAALLDYLAARPIFVAHALEPFEIRSCDATGIGKNIGNAHDAALIQNAVGFGCGRAIRPFSNHLA